MAVDKSAEVLCNLNSAFVPIQKSWYLCFRLLTWFEKLKIESEKFNSKRFWNQ